MTVNFEGMAEATVTPPDPVITRESLIKALREVVAEVGEDYVYQTQGRQGYPYLDGCFYRNPDGSEGCMFGRALIRLGAPYSHHWENRRIGQLLAHLGVSDADLHHYANHAQSRQDKGAQWGPVVEELAELLGVA